MTIRLWDGVMGGTSITTLEGHSDQVYCVAFSSDGSRLASGSYDDTIRLWDGFTGVAIATIYSRADPYAFPQSFSASMLHSSWSFVQDIPTSLWYIAVSLLDDNRPVQNLPLCWLPSDFEPNQLAFAASLAIVGCQGGQVIIFDISELLAMIR
jgi:WD40 repeat protein